MTLATTAMVAAAAFLLGSIPFGYLLVRVFHGIDVRSIGSGNIGATNVARTGGKKTAIVTLVLDVLKGWLPVFLVLHTNALHVDALHLGAVPAGSLQTLAAVAALAAVLGHMFTPWLGFKGGKGVATSLGVFLALSPAAVLIAVAIFAITIALTRYVSLGSILAAAAFPLLQWRIAGKGLPAAALAVSAIIALLVIIRHHQNIGRLMAGTESRFGAKKA
jgi:glycerol-3-phosphate acyltransferase PlsY